jgi:hypothetical protein
MLGRLKIKGKQPWMNMSELLVQLWMQVCIKYYTLSFLLISFYISLGMVFDKYQ